MIFDARTIRLKDGRACTLRPTHPDDAPAMIEYMEKTSGETPFLLRYPDEVSYTLEEERALLDRVRNDPLSVMMAAVVDGRIAGNCSISGFGQKRKIRHRCSLAIALYREFWHLGIGSAMIAYLTELARQIGYEQIELELIAENEQAKALYEKCGFEVYGRRPHATRFDDGSFHDEILMMKIL